MSCTCPQVPTSPVPLHVAPRSQDPTYPRNWREALALSPWASTWAPAAVMWLFPSLEGKTEEAEKAHRTGGRVVPCRPGPDRATWTSAVGTSVQDAEPVPQRLPPSEPRELIRWLLRVRFLPAKGKEWGRQGLVYKAV